MPVLVVDELDDNDDDEAFFLKLVENLSSEYNEQKSYDIRTKIEIRVLIQCSVI